MLGRRRRRGIFNAVQGNTTIEEVLRVISE
jgi:type II secretory ATPase GspE/PulE/Tfp pilus assembly ATPase PilB-like protein